MFPVSVCLRIESKRFVEEETQRKRLGSLQDEFAAADLRFCSGATKMVALLPINELELLINTRLKPDAQKITLYSCFNSFLELTFWTKPLKRLHCACCGKHWAEAQC